MKGIGDSYFDQQKRVLTAKINDIWIINTYAPHGDLGEQTEYHYKLDWYTKFLEFINKEFSPDEKIILLGDLNVALEDIDVWNPELLKDSIGTMEEERKALRSYY
ncbi:MAG: hypothetical protein Q9M89_05370 [Persephonella sp.]|nr:hypothetical protein [Persephonella sp.]